jgi:hypothetical protein
MSYLVKRGENYLRFESTVSAAIQRLRFEWWNGVWSAVWTSKQAHAGRFARRTHAKEATVKLGRCRIVRLRARC